MIADGNGARDTIRVVAARLLGAVQRNWRLLAAAILAIGAISYVIELSDRQGRFDIPSGYAVRMTCEADPEAPLWSGGCERIAADIARTDKPGFLALYQAFVRVHHRHIPSPATRARFASVPCEASFDIDASLSGTRYVFTPLRRHFAEACTQAEVRAIMGELDERDRALLAIEREGLSHAALYAGALANLTEPLVVFIASVIVAALVIL